MTVDNKGDIKLARAEWMKLLGLLFGFMLTHLGGAVVLVASLWSDNRVQDYRIDSNTERTKALEIRQQDAINEIKIDIRDIKNELKKP